MIVIVGGVVVRRPLYVVKKGCAVDRTSFDCPVCANRFIIAVERREKHLVQNNSPAEGVMPEAYILSAVRSPIGKYLGSLAEVAAPKLGAEVIAEALRRANHPGEPVDEVIMGCVLQAGLGQNPARQAALKAGLPDRTAAVTINKVCGSGLRAVMFAAQAVRVSDADLVVAGGMESMSRAPFLLSGVRSGWKYGDQQAVDSMLHDGLCCAFENWHMGEAAEHIAEKFDVSRAEQDRFAAQSQQRAFAAWEGGLFNAEVI